MSGVVRIALSVLLLSAVYLETGWATSLALFLVFLRAEIQDATPLPWAVRP